MRKQDQPPSSPLLSPVKFRFIYKLRAWLRTRTGRITLPIFTWLVGLLLGFVILLLMVVGGDGQLHSVPNNSAAGEIVVEANRAFLTDLTMQNLKTSGIPGTVKNVQVTLKNGDQMTVTGDDEFSLLGIGMVRNFTLVLQPYVTSCVLQMHVIHADVGGIPITGFVETFESNINTQLRTKPTGLPTGFTYCTVRVRTETEGMFVSYSATPV
jgi:hypothetical protein